MISLAQRVRDFRYSKGWGPDELASRAEISRTALYQIESGKTGLPRAGTLRRIAVALEVSMDELLGHPEAPVHQATYAVNDHHTLSAARGREFADWIPADGGPLTFSAGNLHAGMHSPYATLSETRAEEPRFSVEPQRKSASMSFDSLLLREGELMSKLHEILRSPLGAGAARIVDELHQMVAKNRNLS
ncbi:MAG: helix-turn-helix transcriptional regulator [Isosphaeraceae bacterium]